MSSKMQNQVGVIEDTDIKESHYPMMKVLLHNDDKSTFEYVIQVLMQIFGKPAGDAKKITLNIHETGLGLAGIYTQEVAELKLEQVVSCNSVTGFPLKATMEKA